MFVSDHPIIVDGVRLDTLAWGVEAADLTIGGLRSGDQVLAGLDGVVPSWDDAREPSIYALSMFIRGTDEDGLVPADRSRWGMFRENLDALLHLFGRTSGPLDVREVVTSDPVTTDVQDALNAPQRQAFAKVDGALAPTMEPGAVGRLTVALSLSSVYWADVDPQTWTSGPLTTGVAHTVDTMEGGTAPVDDAVAVLTGPATSPVVIRDAHTGAFVRLNANVPAGQAWRVNVGTWSSRMAAGLTVDSDDTEGVSMDALTDQGGNYPSLLRLTPTLDTGARRVSVAVDAAGMTAATTLTLSARRKYL